MASSISYSARARTGTGPSDRRRPATNSASAREGGVGVLAAAWFATSELSREVMAASSQSAVRARSEYRIECASAPRAWGSEDLWPWACHLGAWGALHLGTRHQGPGA